MKAYLYSPAEWNAVQCHLCAHRCLIPEGKRGICRVRENEGGVLRTLVYGRLIAGAVDPVEKKPLFHFLPGTLTYSIATVGCNFRCRFCQNADIAQMPADREGKIMGEPVQPEAVVTAAERSGSRSISYTYTEPTIFFEFALDTARLAKARGLRNIFVTNGFMTPEALEMIAPFLDAANVDLKAYTDSYYRKYCGGALTPVKETLIGMKRKGILVEVTTLIVPGLNDDPAELTALAGFIATQLGPGTPWHISRFHPTYKMLDRPVTPVATLAKAREIGTAAGLKYVYPGNVPGHEGESTVCSACGKVVIRRWGFKVQEMSIVKGCCRYCKTPVEGVWE